MSQQASRERRNVQDGLPAKTNISHSSPPSLSSLYARRNISYSSLPSVKMFGQRASFSFLRKIYVPALHSDVMRCREPVGLFILQQTVRSLAREAFFSLPQILQRSDHFAPFNLHYSGISSVLISTALSIRRRGERAIFT